MAVELRPLDTAALKQALEKKDYQMIMVGQWSVPHDDPSMHYISGYWHSKSTYTIFTSPELDGKINQLAASLNVQERIKLHQDIQAEIQKNTPEMGLDLPIWQQYLRWCEQILQLNLGTSIKSGETVVKELLDRLPATLELQQPVWLLLIWLLLVLILGYLILKLWLK